MATVHVIYELNRGTTTERLALADPHDGEPWRDDTLKRLFIWSEADEEWQPASPDVTSYAPHYATAAFSAAGNTTYQPPILSHPATLDATASAGASPYTRTITLPIVTSDGDAYTTGETRLICVAVPASANPTVEIRNATSGGTLLGRIYGSATEAQKWWAECIFTGAAWKVTRSGFSPVD